MTNGTSWALRLIWGLVALTAVFVALRLYTRLVVVKKYANDDNYFILAFVLFIGCAIPITVSTHYGLGQYDSEVSPENAEAALLWLDIGAMCGIFSLASAKWSLGLLLQRIVIITWQKLIIYFIMGLSLVLSIAAVAMVWLRCESASQRIAHAYCYSSALRQIPTALFISSIISNCFYAFFPWYILWNLNMNRREKIGIAVSMSFGLFAIVCAVERLNDRHVIATSGYLYNGMGLVVWSAVENSVTIICAAIPACRPLYKGCMSKLFTIISNRSGQQTTNTASRPRQQESDLERGQGSNTKQVKVNVDGGGPFFELRDLDCPPTATQHERTDEVARTGGRTRSGTARLVPRPVIEITIECATTYIPSTELCLAREDSPPLNTTVTKIESTL
ncbi:hypothetical protein B0T22DRAFT_148646 [Podospora appendiculata]|uniref:Rhodopsin domain-containing protein n=1 Tax=Podospora appendiculata TaxID=314037 RepID=A0AAE1CC89_9PEZI|nr:hypothetical protein B0T22DRAFT_148646 [Podospora appendiculata]